DRGHAARLGFGPDTLAAVDCPRHRHRRHTDLCRDILDRSTTCPPARLVQRSTPIVHDLITLATTRSAETSPPVPAGNRSPKKGPGTRPGPGESSVSHNCKNHACRLVRLFP